ncbi:MAG: 1-phosphofructokinase [Clostridia bacterium]|nr:1-phosphofructokinase [Clostridia bacterium]
MHTVVTVTLNPCVDKTAVIDRLMPYELNRVRESRVDPAGKGINVAHILQSAGVDVLACGFIAGQQGEYILEATRKEDIPTDFLKVAGETRVNLKLLDASVQKITEINEPGFFVPAESVDLFLSRFDSLTKGVSLVVLSGSLPPGVPDTVYRDCIRIARGNGARAILDADGGAFARGVEARPFAVKPNTRELERLVGRSLDSLPAVYTAACGLIEKGTKLVIVSMGGDGALIMDENQAFRAQPWAVEVKSPTGAGDSMVAALAFALLRGMPLESVARLSTAAGSFTASLPGTTLCRMEDAARFAEKVKITPFAGETAAEGRG